jgi:sulfur dioxygenase
VIDPVLEHAERAAAAAAALGVKLVAGLNTHAHADHVTGTGRRLKALVPGLRSMIAAAAGARADVLLAPGDEVRFGRHALRELATPGHTDGCVTYHTPAGGGMAFTGDALMIRGCVRTDFQNGSPATLFASVRSELFSLPPATAVFPAHDYRGARRSSIVEERALNPRLGLHRSAAEFAAIMDNLNLPYPKMINVAGPANRMCAAYEVPPVAAAE